MTGLAASVQPDGAAGRETLALFDAGPAQGSRRSDLAWVLLSLRLRPVAAVRIVILDAPERLR